MKKLMVFAFFAMALVSCKKDHTCECKTGSTVVSTTTINDTKSKAKATCDLNDASLFGVVVECEIK